MHRVNRKASFVPNMMPVPMLLRWKGICITAYIYAWTIHSVITTSVRQSPPGQSERKLRGFSVVSELLHWKFCTAEHCIPLYMATLKRHWQSQKCHITCKKYLKLRNGKWTPSPSKSLLQLQVSNSAIQSYCKYTYVKWLGCSMPND